MGSSCKMHLTVAFLTVILASVESGTTLETRGAFVVNASSGVRVYLKCVNWYGAHSNLFVPHGLESQSIGFLVDKLVESKANCVRIPVSSDFSNLNPVLKPEAVKAVTSEECPVRERAMDVMDCLVRAVQDRGLLVIFNNHCSWPDWVGKREISRQGLWHYEFDDHRKKNYSMESWITSLEILVRRYNMTAIDIRNEISDEGKTRVTWGETTDPKTDWLAASTVASKRIRAIDESILIILGGLCWNFDLRAMMKNVGPKEVFESRKLIYTVHGYSYSFWWNIGDGLLDLVHFTSLIGGLVGFFCGFLVFYKHFYSTKNHYRCFTSDNGFVLRGIDICEIFAASVWFHGSWFATALVYYNISTEAGCSTVAVGAIWLIVLSLILMIGATLMLLCYYDWFCFKTFVGESLCWLGLYFMTLFFVTLYLLSHQSYYDFLNLWALQDRPVPVFVGEIGVPVSAINKNHGWYIIWNYVRKTHDLDFAFWAFNGRKWFNDKWEDESFGLLSYDYGSWRDLEFTVKLFE
jgi:hypothetical protein